MTAVPRVPGGNALPARWCGRAHFAILETGFGNGSNFLATWQAWCDDPQRPRRLHYVAVVAQPLPSSALDDAAGAATHAAQLRSAWPCAVPGFHRRHFADGAVTLTLVFGPLHTAVPAIGGRFDAFLLDGLASAENLDRVSQTLIDDLAWLAVPDALLVADTLGEDMRRRLASPTGIPFGHADFGSEAPTPPPAPQRIAVIGAGIAGISCAERLAARGCAVTLFERRDRIAAETSGNHQAILLPVLAVDPTRLSRLNRAAFFYGLHRLHALAAAGHPVDWDACGVFQIARDAAHARKQQAIVAEQALPEDFAQFIDAAAGSARVGTTVAGPGWWFPQAGWLAPASLAAALLAAGGERIDCRLGCDIAGLAQHDGGWDIHAGDGSRLWRGDAVVLAHAHGIRSLPQASYLPIRCFRGQVSHLPAASLAGLPRTVVCREGYLAPAHAGFAGLGATFQRSQDMAPNSDDHASNLARLSSMLPGLADRFDPGTLDGRVGLRPVSPDKLPLLGALPLPAGEPRPAAHVEWPRWPGLFVASGYGARGFVWAPLMAELLACQMLGEPLPLEQELAAAVDPARFPWKGTL